MGVWAIWVPERTLRYSLLGGDSNAWLVPQLLWVTLDSWFCHCVCALPPLTCIQYPKQRQARSSCQCCPRLPTRGPHPSPLPTPCAQTCSLRRSGRQAPSLPACYYRTPVPVPAVPPNFRTVLTVPPSPDLPPTTSLLLLPLFFFFFFSGEGLRRSCYVAVPYLLREGKNVSHPGHNPIVAHVCGLPFAC